MKSVGSEEEEFLIGCVILVMVNVVIVEFWFLIDIIGSSVYYMVGLCDITSMKVICINVFKGEVFRWSVLFVMGCVVI